MNDMPRHRAINDLARRCLLNEHVAVKCMYEPVARDPEGLTKFKKVLEIQLY
ncbi:hypothetical protein WN51_03145 [Melipona quadrifasciata]|uniref:Uncharacterized protein n=1 Tax=Melipona quadrifasciata TaxID=166423 RepID=A0A0M8ZVV4_9HYME|nr:hypothetical protein WN51_03145 [Melipona quadrifasciata]